MVQEIKELILEWKLATTSTFLFVRWRFVLKICQPWLCTTNHRRVSLKALCHFITNNVHQFIKCWLDIEVVFSTRFKEWEAKLVSQFLSLFMTNCPVFFHVALIANKNNLRIVPWVRFYLTCPKKRKHFSFRRRKSVQEYKRGETSG